MCLLTWLDLSLQGENGGPGQKGGKGDKGEAVSVHVVSPNDHKTILPKKI